MVFDDGRMLVQVEKDDDAADNDDDVGGAAGPRWIGGDKNAGDLAAAIEGLGQ